MRASLVAILATVVWLLIAPEAIARGIGFSNFTGFSSGENPASVAVADFDGDGTKDLAVTQFDGDGDAVNERGVTIFQGAEARALRRRGVSFQNLGTTIFAPQPDGIVARRVDGDDDPDLVIGALTDDVLLMRGEAGATFSSPEPVDVGGNSPREVAVADFNGDARLDIAFSAQTSGMVGVALQRANETFKPPRFRGGGGGTVVAAKLNGDARSDLVALGNDGKVRTYLGRPGGKLRIADAKGAGPGPGDIAVGYLNGDGAADVGIANREFSGQGENIVSTIPGQGGGELGKRKTFEVGFTARRTSHGKRAAARRGIVGDGVDSVVIADMGHEPREDLAVTLEGADRIAALRSKSGPGFNFSNPFFFPAGDGPRDIVASQLDGVRDVDLAIVRSFTTDAISVLFDL